MRMLLALAAIGATCAPLVISAPAQAQATRTWVSGVGDDANPCSRTAPCKTFAGAISKTATGGEINVLDPGGFGGVTITKSITISSEGFEAGVLVSGTNAIIVNTPAGSVVNLRGLDIQGLSTGLNGITFIQAGVLHVENCVIRGFNSASAGNGINFAPTGGGELYVSDTVISENGNGTANSAGIRLVPGVGGNSSGVIKNVLINNINGHGILADGTNGGAGFSILNSTTSGNSLTGVIGQGNSVGLMINNHNSSFNVQTGVGTTGTAGVVVRVGSSIVVGNNFGFSGTAPSQLLSYGNNQVGGNANDGAATGPAPFK